jgi:phosphatidate phosphatase APP1
MRTLRSLALLALAAQGCAAGSLFVVDDGTAALRDGPGTGVISDFDDTIAATNVADKLRMLWDVLFTRPEDVRAVAGVADAFGRAEAKGAAPFVYVSASPTFLRERIRAFLRDEGLPEGPLVLKDWLRERPGDPSSKQARIVDVMARMPSRSFVLVGDSGERDPEIYAAIARDRPDQVAGIVVVATDGSDLRAARFAGMTLVDDYAAAPDAIADLVD